MYSNKVGSGLHREDEHHQSNTSLGFVNGQYKTSSSFFPSELGTQNLPSNQTSTSAKHQQHRTYHRTNSKRWGNNQSMQVQMPGQSVFQNHHMAMHSMQHQSAKYGAMMGAPPHSSARKVSKKLSSSKLQPSDKRMLGSEYTGQSSMLDISSAGNDPGNLSAVVDHPQHLHLPHSQHHMTSGMMTNVFGLSSHEASHSAVRNNDYMLAQQQFSNMQRLRFL